MVSFGRPRLWRSHFLRHFKCETFECGDDAITLGAVCGHVMCGRWKLRGRAAGAFVCNHQLAQSSFLLRINAILTYEKLPDQKANAYSLRKFFGRTAKEQEQALLAQAAQ